MISIMPVKSITFAPYCKERIDGLIDTFVLKLTVYNYFMKLTCGLALASAFLLFACQPIHPGNVTILDNDQIIILQTNERVPSALLLQAGITLTTNDRVLVNGFPADLNQPIASTPITIQTRRAKDLTLIIAAQGEQKLQSSALTVGEALAEANVWLREGDKISPPLDSPISNLQSPISISSSHPLSITSNAKQLQIESSGKTVGEALTEAGIPLLGLD